MQSVVSFDQGGEWVPLRKPANSKCDATAKDPDKVKRGNWCLWRKYKNRNLSSLDEICVYLEVTVSDSTPLYDELIKNYFWIAVQTQYMYRCSVCTYSQ